MDEDWSYCFGCKRCHASTDECREREEPEFEWDLGL